MFSIDDIIKEKDPEFINRKKRIGERGECCGNSQENYCIYDPCCFCKIRKEGMIPRESMCRQCRIQYGVNDLMEYDD